MVDALSRSRVSDAELLVQPDASCDLGAEMAMLVRQTAHHQMENARAMQEVEDRMQTAAENEEIAKMREKAAVQLAAGLTSSVTSMACNTVNLGAQLKDFRLKCEAAKDPQAVSKAQLDVSSSEVALTKTKTEIVSAGAKVQTDLMQFAANQLDADAKAAGSAAHHHERLSQAAKDEVEAARKLAQDAVEFRKEWTETTNATLLALSRRA
jgi:hypothetical protein